MNKQLYSAIDASLNRALEGIRVCEDIMRFSMRMTSFSITLKELRHRIGTEAKHFSRSGLLYGRDVETDAQKFVDTDAERSRASLEELFASNIHRAIEAVRTLEEFSKLSDSGIGNNPFQEIRFSLYHAERVMVSAIKRQDKIEMFRRSLYAILDSTHVKDGRYQEAAAAMIRGGAAVIQLRMKNNSMKEIVSVAADIAPICREGRVLLIINDHPDIAMLSCADGVHLGTNDVSPRDTRTIIPPDMIIGMTACSYQSGMQALEQEPDYIAIGPIFDTKYCSGTGMHDLRGIGLGDVARLKAATAVPLVAIGGITPGHVAEIIQAGADTVAALSYLYKKNSIEENCRDMVQALEA